KAENAKPAQNNNSDPLETVNDFTKAAEEGADFLGTLKDREAAKRETAKVKSLLKDVSLKQKAYNRIIHDDLKKAVGSPGVKFSIPPEVKERADKASNRYLRETARYLRLIGEEESEK